MNKLVITEIRFIIWSERKFSMLRNDMARFSKKKYYLFSTCWLILNTAWTTTRHVELMFPRGGPVPWAHIGPQPRPQRGARTYDSSLKMQEKWLIFLYRTSKYLTPRAILCKSQIRPKVVYRSHIWTGVSHSPLSRLDKVQKRLHRWDVASLSPFNRYFHGKCPDEMHSLVPPVLTFRTSHAKHIVVNHPHSLSIPLMSSMFHSNSFFSLTAALWNRLSRDCILEHQS